MTYDKAYFIAKFSAIPEELWCSNLYVGERDTHCALGHCGHNVGNGGTEESAWLEDILPNVKNINDGRCTGYQQPTPKARILAALNDLP
jgi:hypothetical protein